MEVRVPSLHTGQSFDIGYSRKGVESWGDSIFTVKAISRQVSVVISQEPTLAATGGISALIVEGRYQ